MDIQAIRSLAYEAERLHLDTDRIRFCFDVYLEFARDGREPTADMDRYKARIQLDDAIAAFLGYGPPWE